MSTLRSSSKTRRSIRAAAILAVATGIVLGSTGVASANTRTLVEYDAKIKGIANNSHGTGSVWKYRFEQPGTPSSTGWGSQVNIKGLSKGTYQVMVVVGSAIDNQGNAHQFQNYDICSFYTDGNYKTPAGCGAGVALPDNVDLSHSYLSINSPVTAVASGDLAKKK